tara:strand:- start:10880 stop:11113 length:234 start_codon:yes stop_codon:yes gene_type:complete
MSDYSTIEGCIRQSCDIKIKTKLINKMDLNKIIINVLEKYQDSQPNMASESFRKILAKEIEVEVDKYCLMLMNSLNG